MAQEWHMPRPGAACAACARAFELNEAFQAHLFEAAAGYERRDYCVACPVDATDALASWRSRRVAPGQKKAPPLDRATLLSMVERLEGAVDPQKRRFRFVLALLLWQKKTLNLRGTENTSEGEVWSFETKHGESRFAVHDPALAENELEQLSEQLDRLLAGDTAAVEELAVETADA